VHSVICTRARAPSGDDDRDSFSIYVSRLRSAPDRSARRLIADRPERIIQKNPYPRIVLIGAIFFNRSVVGRTQAPPYRRLHVLSGI
jgi:hypothetical protein